MPRTVATSELRQELDRTLSEHFGTPRHVVELERSASIYQTSSPVEELEVTLDDGTNLRLVFKDLSEDSLLKEARGVKPSFLHDPLREIEAYRTVLAPAGLSTAAYYGAAVDAERGRYWLFLEKVEGVPLWQIGELTTWEHAARWLGEMHGRFEGDLGWQGDAAHMLRYDADFYRLWLRRAQAFAAEAKRGRARKGLEWLAERHDRLVEQLVELPVTFVHGEFYAGNVLIGEDSGTPRVCPIDWEMAAIGPGLLDLAALTGGEWDDEWRKGPARAYRAALPESSGLPSAPAEFQAALDCCRLHLALQWLGWAKTWSPPLRTRQDWLGEALRLAEELEL
jgi:Ser/Thr protein kinase RdoA (MazF antagonist)